jgi:alkylhydroperoxidase/carboxymuconolactone decarboxylase family protein YurZ
MTDLRLESEERVTGLDPVFGPMGIAAGRHIWGITELSMREKAVLSVVADVCHPCLELPFELHVRMGLANGMSIEDFREVLRQVAPEAGYSPCSAAFERLSQIEGGPQAPAPGPAGDSPAPGTRTADPAAHWAGLRSLDAGLAAYAQHQADQLGERHGLSPRECALGRLAVDVGYQTLGGPFAQHLGQLFQAGASSGDIRAALRFLAEWSLPKAWQAMDALVTYLTGAQPGPHCGHPRPEHGALRWGGLTSHPGPGGQPLAARHVHQEHSQVDVTSYQPQTISPADDSGTALISTRLTETFTGGITGHGTADHIRVIRADGTTTFAGAERITGTVGSRHGSFALTASGHSDADGVVHGNWRVVEGSATGELAGLAGTGEFTARQDPSGQWHATDTFTYWLG